MVMVWIGNRMILEMFYHLEEMMSRHFKQILYIEKFKPKYKNDEPYWLFYKNVIEAIDTTHIPCVCVIRICVVYLHYQNGKTQLVMLVFLKMHSQDLDIQHQLSILVHINVNAIIFYILEINLNLQMVM
ncbi:hypothetical protein S83_059818, partial [Arachis hypogaea]